MSFSSKKAQKNPSYIANFEKISSKINHFCPQSQKSCMDCIKIWSSKEELVE